MAVERLWKSSNNPNDVDSWQDLFIVSTHILLQDIMATYNKYNETPLPIQYNESGLKYDVGYTLLDAGLPIGAATDRTVGILPINIKLFQNEYNNIVGSKDLKVDTMINNPKYKGISKNTIAMVMSYTI